MPNDVHRPAICLDLEERAFDNIVEARLYSNVGFVGRMTGGDEGSLMAQHRLSPLPWLALSSLMSLSGCAPTVDVIGVYFPGWLVSAIAGVACAYGIVRTLGRRARSREIADSGLFFVGLATSLALMLWWVAFSHF